LATLSRHRRGEALRDRSGRPGPAPNPGPSKDAPARPCRPRTGRRHDRDFDPAACRNDTWQDAVDDAVMREGDQHLIDDLVVPCGAADRRYRGVRRPLADEVVAVESPDRRGTETARHRRHMIDARFRGHCPKRLSDIQGLKLGAHMLCPALGIVYIVSHRCSPLVRTHARRVIGDRRHECVLGWRSYEPRSVPFKCGFVRSIVTGSQQPVWAGKARRPPRMSA
jgi:hypothetical protein